MRAWPTPPSADLWGYAQAVRERTLAVVAGITPEALAEVPQKEHPTQTVGQVLAHVITETSMHIGEVDYLRGVQRGLDSTS